MSRLPEPPLAESPLAELTQPAPSSFEHALGVDSKQLTWLLALQYLNGFGAQRLGDLADQPQWLEALQAKQVPAQWQDRLSRPQRASLLAFLTAPSASAEWAAAERAQQWLVQRGASVLLRSDPAYPRALQCIDDSPAWVFAYGDATLCQKACIAIVGTRKPSRVGSAAAYAIARDLAAAGFTIVSGMALGIDSEAHRGALDAGGRTIAVWASGLDQPYPRSNRDLAEQIASSGCIVTEQPLTTTARPGYFPRRNRIVSGLAAATLVVEAELKSGSMITASTALAQNREVFAVPGSINNPRSRGCHALLRDGAGLVESAQDIIDALAGMRSLALEPLPDPFAEPAASAAHTSAAAIQRAELPAALASVLDSLEDELESFDHIAARTGLSLAELSAALVDLELAGLIVAEAGCYARCLRPSSAS